jgi:hypothetical protein
MSPEELKEYFAGVVDIPPLVLEYRLHYNDRGEIYSCTMQQHPESTNYIVTDKETYEQYYNYRVVEGRLIKITHDNRHKVRLIPANTGYCVVKGHAGLIVEPNETYQDTEYYGRNN